MEETKEKKELEQLTERELLVEIARQQRKSARSSRIAAAAAVVLALVFAALLLVAAPVVKQAGTTLVEAENVIVRAQGSLENVDELARNLNGMVTENTDAVNKALSQIGQVDIESLNQSIKELSDILTPLARLFNR